MRKLSFSLKSVAKNTALFTLPGAAGTALSHPLEHSLYGRGSQRKLKRRIVRDSKGTPVAVVLRKNPKRYGNIKIPFTSKKIEYDRGSYGQHLLARLPKGVLNSVGIFGGRALTQKLLKIKK